MTSLEELCTFFEAILVVALSEYIGFNKNGKELPSESHLRYLNNIIKCELVSEVSGETNENFDYKEINIEEETDYQDASDWIQWSANIYDNAQHIADNCVEGTAINACYNPNFANKIKTRLMPYLALWSGVIQPHFRIGAETATSTSVESEFAELKNRAFKGQLPMRADKFVHEHLDYIDGRIKLASCQKDILNANYEEDNVTHNYSSANSTEINSVKNSSTSTFNYDTTDNVPIQNINEQSAENNEITLDISDKSDNKTDYNICENWRGLVSKPQEECSNVKRRKPSYLDKCPEWDYIKLARDQNIPLMLNGNICKPVNVDGKTLNISHTCAFDSILHLIASGIASLKCYEDKIKTSNNRTLNLAMSILHNGKITRDHYNERAKILIDLPLFNDKLTTYTRTIYKLNTICNVAHLINYLFADLPSCQKTIICSCGYSKTKQIIELNLNVGILLRKGLQYMQEAIDDTLAITVKCKKCLSIVMENIECGKHVFIDTTVFTDIRFTNRDKTIKYSLETIATNIILNNETYILVGIINYINSSNDENNGHYVTYARCGNHWYEYDDIKKKRYAVNIKTIITPHLIFYVNTAT